VCQKSTSPIQRGILYPLAINFKNYDELHLSILDARFVYFPLQDPSIFLLCLSIVEGIIYGTCRIVIYRLKKPLRLTVGRELQELKGGTWEIVGINTFLPRFRLVKFLCTTEIVRVAG
jgi:hypothetical protein